MSNKKRPSKAQKRAAIEFIREGAEYAPTTHRSQRNALAGYQYLAPSGQPAYPRYF